MSRRERRTELEASAPIEMRFVDMFMAAIGSLVFIALLLVLLLPNIGEVVVSGVVKEVRDTSVLIEEGGKNRLVEISPKTELTKSDYSHIKRPSIGDRASVAGTGRPDGSIIARTIDVRTEQPDDSAFFAGKVVEIRDKILRVEDRHGRLRDIVMDQQTKVSASQGSATVAVGDQVTAGGLRKGTNAIFAHAVIVARPDVAEGELDKLALKRWFNMSLYTRGCGIDEPYFYVRATGPLQDFDTGEKKLKRAAAFDASNLQEPTLLVGQSYTAISRATELEELVNKTELMHQKFSEEWSLLAFHSVALKDTQYVVYTALKEPTIQLGACVVQPIFVSADGATFDDEIVLRTDRPFSRLGVISAEKGQVSYSPEARLTDEIATFSSLQSAALCDKKRICQTTDARHYTVRTTGREEKGFEINHFDLEGGDLANVSPLKDSDLSKCWEACVGKYECLGVSFDKWSKWCFLKGRISRLRKDARSRIVLKPRAGIPPGPATDQLVIERYPGKAFPYSGQLSSTMESSDECEAECSEAPKCIAYTYFKTQRQCRLMTSADSAYNDDRNAESGAKRERRPDERDEH